MRTLLKGMIGVALAACGYQPPLRADVMAYGTATDGNLYSVDLSTAVATLIGPMGEVGPMGQPTFPEGLALSPTGTLFSTDSAGDLFAVNRTTGAATKVGNTGRMDIEGLTFDGNTLLASNVSFSPTTIFSINTTNASTTSLVFPSTSYVRAMTLEDSNDVFVTSDSCSAPLCSTNSELSSINLTTGSVSNIGALVDGNQLTAALAYNGVLYSLDSAGNEYIVNPSNAGLTLVGNAGGHFYLDATIVTPVPEPAAVSLLGMAVLALVAPALRRRFVKRGMK